MKNIIILILPVLVFTYCHSKVQKGESRLELVKKTPYRSLNVPDELKERFVSLLETVLPLASKNDSSVFLYVVTANNSLHNIPIPTTDLEKVRSFSYNLWKNKNFVGIFLVYISHTKNVTSEEISRFIVVEIEHELFTGTLFLFYSTSDTNDAPSSITYVERN